MRQPWWPLAGWGVVVWMGMRSTGCQVPLDEAMLPAEAEQPPVGGATTAEEAEPPSFECLTVTEDRAPMDFETPPADVKVPKGRRLVYLNRSGGTYAPGVSDSLANTSIIPRYVTAVPPFEGTEAQWQFLVACVRERYARWNIEITDVDPGNVLHVEAVVGGRPEWLGLDPMILGIAPHRPDCGVIENAVAFIFSQVQSDKGQHLCWTITHEVGHTLGLEHEYYCPDPMTYVEDCGAVKWFQDVWTSCGEWGPRGCGCSSSQNSFRHLESRLGPASTSWGPGTVVTPGGGGGSGDLAAPTVILAAPADGTVFSAGASIQLSALATDASGLSNAQLVWNYPGGTIELDCRTPSLSSSCVQEGDRYTWYLSVSGTGERSWFVRATDRAGNRGESERRRLFFW